MSDRDQPTESTERNRVSAGRNPNFHGFPGFPGYLEAMPSTGPVGALSVKAAEGFRSSLLER
ncbi:MAG: hypothetical protein ACE10G_07960, partial [Gemmatimonadales bacterium]